MNSLRISVLLSLLALACGGTKSSPAAPVAQAGADQAVASAATVTLDGSASSDPAGLALAYLWTQTSGPPVTLSSFTVVGPTFSAPPVAAGQPPAALVFGLAVTSASGTSSTSSVAITVSPVRLADPLPVANAGPGQAVASGAQVTLDGSKSTDAAGQPLTFAWTGPVALAATASPTFTAPVVPAGSAPVTLVFSLVVSDTASSAPAFVIVIVSPAGSTANPVPPGTPPPAISNPNPPLAGGSGSNRFEMGAAAGLYLVDPAKGEPSVQGLVNVTYGPISSGNFIPPDGTTVTMNGVPLLRDPNLNGSYWRVDPAGPQPTIGSGGELVLVASVTVAGKQDVRTLVLPCPADVVVTSTPPIGSKLVPAAAPLHLVLAADLTLNVNIAPMASIFPQALLYGYEPATRTLVAPAPGSSLTNVSAGALGVDVPVVATTATTAAAYLLDLRWPGHWVIDGQTGGFCGLAKRWTYTR